MRKWAPVFVLFFLATGGTASALSLTPAPYGPYLFTENFGPNGTGYPEGWFLSVGTFIDDTPDEVPGNILSVTASQAGGSNFFNLNYFYRLPNIPYWGVENIRQPYSPSGPTGRWTITASDRDGEVISVNTHFLDRPATVPTTTVWFEKFNGTDWFVLWDFAPFREYTYGVDQIEVRIMRSIDDQIHRVGPMTLGGINPPEINGIQIPEWIVALDEPLWFRIIARDLDRYEVGSPLENRSSSFGYFNPNPAAGFAALECAGFETPMNKDSVKVISPKVLPFKAQLFHADGSPVIDADLVAPPVITVRYIPEQPGVPEDVTDLAIPAGLGTEDHQFAFTTEGKWQYNLSTRNYSQQGTYNVGIRSGDSNEYVINPSCLGTFVIE